MTPACEACGASVAADALECPDCGHNPSRYLAGVFLAVGAAFAAASILFPLFLVIPLFTWPTALVVGVMMWWNPGYWSRHYGAAQHALGASGVEG